jgi:hypothetical protein
VKAWGKVRTELEKRIARELMEQFPDESGIQSITIFWKPVVGRPCWLD